MPKRITRTKEQDYKNFRSGFSYGVSAAVFAMQLKTLRLKKGVTIEEAALATNNNSLRLQGLEAGHLNAYMSLNTDDLFALAKYFDVAIDISFKSQNTILNPIHDSIQVKTFLEEFKE
jgi:transcriptional regulator with XRE-family HTH domain